MKIRHIVLSLLPALAVADDATTVPDDEPLLPPLPEELLSPQAGQEGLPATARPVISYRAPKDEEQTWLRLFAIRPTDEWPDIFRRVATSSREKDMQMCHGYALWLRGQQLLHLRYDDDLSLSGIHADGHAYGVLYVEFSPYGIRISPMQGYDLSGSHGGVCWQDAASKLWSWAEAEQFWAELPRLLKSDATKSRATSAQDSAVKREVSEKGQRMVVFWATPGYPARAWWTSFARLHAAVGPTRFSLVAADGLKLWTDVVVPNVRPAAPVPVPAPVQSPEVAPSPSAAPSAPAPVPAGNVPQAVVPAPPPAPAPQVVAPTPASETPPAPVSTAAAPATGPTGAAVPVGRPALPVAPTPVAPVTAGSGEQPLPATLQPATGSARDVAPAASVRPWALEDGVAPSPSKSGNKKVSTPAERTTAPGQPATSVLPPAAAPSPSPAPAPASSSPKPASSGRSLDAVDAVVLP